MGKLIDSNLVVRFLLQDHPIQSAAATNLFKNLSENLYLTDTVVAEVVWVLISFYKLPKQEIIEKIYRLITLPIIESNRAILIRALYFYGNFNIDYIDAYLAAYAEEEKLEGIYSFDADLDKIKEVKRFKPTEHQHDGKSNL